MELNVHMIRNLFNNRFIRFILCGVYVILLIIHNICIKGLVKPAKLLQAFEFLFKEPGDYFPAFICGLLAYPIPFLFLLSFIASILVEKLSMGIEDYETNFEQKKLKIFDVVSSIVIFTLMAVSNSIFINYVLLLGLALAIIILLLIAIAESY